MLPVAFANNIHLSQKIREPIQMKVVEIKSTKEGRRFHLENAETGVVQFTFKDLYENIFASKEAILRSTYVFGEYVQVGNRNKESRDYLSVAGEKITLGDAYIGIFMAVQDSNNYVVRLKDKNGVLVDIVAPKRDVYDLTMGTSARFDLTVSNFSNLQVQFKQNEAVRYRNSDGMISYGRFIKKDEGFVIIKNQNGIFERISQESVFRSIENARTTTYKAPWMLELEKPSDSLKKFLDGAGKLTSLPDFTRMSSEQKVISLMKYLRVFIRWSKGGMQAEDAGLTNFNKLLCTGAGVCRHLAPLLAATLNESGIPAVVVMRMETETKGHAWVEVVLPGKDGKQTYYIADPSNENGTYFKSISEVTRIASENKESFEYRFHAHPNKVYLAPQE